MDEIDKQILTLLQEEARLSYEKIGTSVGLSVSAVNERIKKLQKQGVIAGWKVLIDPQKVGLDILAFIHILLDEKNSFLTHLEKIPEVLECHHTTGEWSYLLKVRCKTIEALEKLLSEKIKAGPGVLRTHTSIALSSPLARDKLAL